MTGRVRLGIYAIEVDEVLARLNHVPTGLLVQSTEEGSDISSKGVVPGDIITKVDGTEIAGTSDLSEVIEGKKPGDTVELEVYRPSQRPNGEGRFFNITVALMEDMGDTTAQQPQTQQVPQQEQQPSEDQYYNDMEDFFNRFSADILSLHRTGPSAVCGAGTGLYEFAGERLLKSEKTAEKS